MLGGENGDFSRSDESPARTERSLKFKKILQLSFWGVVSGPRYNHFFQRNSSSIATLMTAIAASTTKKPMCHSSPGMYMKFIP